MKCPKCGSDDTWRDEVDIGVGIMYGPLHCNACLYSEDGDKDEDILIDPEAEGFLP